ncbi:MAG: isoprenylcysteine carboxylmethyltransferase family protein [Armatimonadetes bacterium]|nr:isoprenylcysteine carboxylmethyltransferase family protein [Armatimonadota bacterium]
MDAIMEFARRRRTLFATLIPLLLWVFGSPTPQSFLAGLVFIIAGQLFRIWAAGFIYKDQTVATGGPYAYMWNPLYFGSLWISLGFAVMANQWWAYLVVFLQFLFFYYLAILSEERYLKANLGAPYHDYYRAVPRFWPTGRRHPQPEGRFGWPQVRYNKEHRSYIPVAVLCILFALKVWGLFDFLPGGNG